MTSEASTSETSRQWPRVGVLILNWKGWQDTIECLESVFRQDYPNFRVIVCDNASPDGSVERLRAWAEGRLSAVAAVGSRLRHLSFPPVEKPIGYVEYSRGQAERGGRPGAEDTPLVIIRTGANLGYAGGNNVGIRYVLARGKAGYDYVWLLNNDAVVDPRALRAMVELAEQDGRVAAVGSKLLSYDEPEVIQALGGGILVPWQARSVHVGEGRRDEPGLQPERLDYITGASLLMRVAATRAVGPLDERYFLYAEEADWCLRAQRQGWRLAYCPESRVWHKGGGSVGYKSPSQDYHSLWSSLVLVRKFFPQWLPVALLYSLYRSCAPKIVRLEGARLMAVLKAYRDFFRTGVRTA